MMTDVVTAVHKINTWTLFPSRVLLVTAIQKDPETSNVTFTLETANVILRLLEKCVIPAVASGEYGVTENVT